MPPETDAFYFDRFALATRERGADIGDVWRLDFQDDGDVWELPQERSQSGHLAPFPPSLVRRAVLLACPERVCTTCGRPFVRRVAPSSELDTARVQARRAMERFKEAGLTDAHLAAIRAVGISDAGMGKRLQTGSGKNGEGVRALAAEAKEALGGYFREFTFAPKVHVGWDVCACNAETRPGHVLDPFSGSNTTLRVASALGFDATGLDLTPLPL